MYADDCVSARGGRLFVSCELVTEIVRPVMTPETEWLQGASLPEMVDLLCRGNGWKHRRRRKLRLFAFACCRRVSHLLTDGRSREALEIGERFVDQLATKQEMKRAIRLARSAWDDFSRRLSSDLLVAPFMYAACALWIALRLKRPPGPRYLFPFAWLLPIPLEEAVLNVASKVEGAMISDKNLTFKDSSEEKVQCDLLRDICGNPFVPIMPLHHCSSTVTRLAELAYSGEDVVFALHVALLESGHPELAHHFQQSLHPKGCWALDLILSKDL